MPILLGAWNVITGKMKDNSQLNRLIQLLASMPGLGPRSARRAALYLLTRRETHMQPLARIMEEVAEAVKTCPVCGNLDMIAPCHVCCDPKRDRSLVCVVAQVADLWAIERTHCFKGAYHVLGGVLSAIDGVGPQDLSISGLLQRVRQDRVGEVVLALPATVDGQSTAHYLADSLNGTGVRITRLAHGVPVGGELDYLDDGTIATALRSRSPV